MEKYADTPDYTSLIGGSNGIVNSLANNFENYLFIEKKDVEDYLRFLEDIPNYLDYVIEITEEDAQWGFTPSQYMLQVNIDAIDELITGEHNIFLDGFEDKVAAADFLTAEEKAVFLENNRIQVDEQVTPAFENLKETMEDWKESFDEWPGLWVMEDGDSYYEYLLEIYTGTSMGAEKLYEYLVDKLDYYSMRLDELLEDDTDYERYLYSDYGFETTDTQEILDSLCEYTKAYFPSFEDPGYQVRELPEVLRSSSLAYYLVPQADNDRINLISLNPDALGDDPGMLYLTLAHEGYPGHLYYSNYTRQQGWHPINELLSNLGYTEGWAEYAAAISLENWQLYGNMARIIVFDQEVNYLLTSLTDIGVNYGGWTLDDVFDLWNEFYYLDSSEDVRDIYDSVIAEPAVILSYPCGYLQICDLEEEVKSLLGDTYDRSDFIRVFLEVGGASFDLTYEYVLNWAREEALFQKSIVVSDN